MKSFSLLGLLAALFLIPTPQEATDYAKLYAEAEELYSERSYGRARAIYLKADKMDLPVEVARWVDFRVADTLWRSHSGTQTSDSTPFDRARKQLEILVRDIERVEDRDRIWAEVQESLADYHWTRRAQRNWSQAWTYYQRALDWWAGAEEIEPARTRYVGMVWKMARPRDAHANYYYGYYGNVVPRSVLENVLKIASTDNDRAHAQYLIAMTFRNQGGGWHLARQVPDAYEAALKPGKGTDWYDDALYHYAQWMASQGRVVRLEGGQWNYRPDFPKAVELYRRLIREFEKGETRYHDDSRRQIEQITSPVVRVSVSNFFLPGSEIQYHLNWRNVKRIDLSLYPVDLTKDVSFRGSNARGRSWLDQIDLAGREKVESWTYQTEDKGKHLPAQKALRLEKPLPTGAYVIEGVAGKKSSRDLVLVSDASLVLKTSGRQALVYVCDVLDGSPIPNAKVRLWERGYDGSTWGWREETKTANAEGLAVFDLVAPSRKGWRRTDLFVSAISKDRQAFATGQSYSGQRSALSWKIYAFTDRPAYRPEETAHWKILARQYDGSIYSTPSGEEIEYQITDPRGAKVSDGTLSLNKFGSAWASLELTGSMPLGEYKISFWTAGKKDGLGSASLFRLEEYKLPEFKVSVRTPEEDGRKKAFKLGESVEIEIEAEYYFGGPVGNATVEVLVYQNPFYHWWSPPREFPWFYEDIDHRSRRHWWGSGQIIKHETIRTDELGRAKLSFDTPHNSNQDFEYRVEARVTDASRRQIVGSGKVRVTRQSYHVYLRPGHHLYRPQDKVTVNVRTIDANDQPLSTSGTITVTKDTHFEVWLDPNGREVTGEKLKRMRSEMRHFPPRPDGPAGPGWRLKAQGYHHDEVLMRIVKTNAEGEADLTFTPEREGYYQFVWASQDRDGSPISAQTTVWVATDASRDLGYRQGGVQIIADKDTFRAGQKAAVMLTVPTNDRYVLFSIEGQDLYSYRLVHLEGTVKLLHLDIEERHVPNIYLTAAMVSDRQLHMDTKQIVVPPVDHFLSVEIKHDRETYQPQEEGTVTIKTLDRNGKPVSAEVSLGLVDESVYAIQSDYAGDPRKFFYGSKRRQIIRTRGTFHHKRFTKLALGDEERLIEVAVRDLGRREEGEKLAPKKEMKGKARADSFAEASGARSRGAERPSAPAEGMLMFDDASEEMEADGRGGFDPDSGGVVVVRSDFRSTVFWQPDVITDEDGHATATVKYPDTLTRWKATARVITEKNQFGIADSSTRTRKPLIARLQAPRFFVVGDLATVSAVINNNTEKKLIVTPSLKAKGLTIIGLLIDGKVKKGEAGPIEISPAGEGRVDWAVSVLEPDAALLTVAAQGGGYQDAMQKKLPIFEHGIEKLVAKAVKLRGKDVTVKIDIPKERKRDSTVLTLQVAPSLAVTMLDALPYLIDYPYGCTEQTMSRFLPAAITAKTLKDLGVKPETVMRKVFGGIEQEHVDRTQAGGKKDLAKLTDMVRKGLERLYDFQHADGGWGWWKQGESDHFMTAYVVWGLALAREADIEIRVDALERGAQFLDKEIVEAERRHDLQAWMLHALAYHHFTSSKDRIGKFQRKAFDNLWARRDDLNAYTRALFALSAHYYKDEIRAKTLIRNLENGVKRDETPDTSVIQRGEQESHPAVQGTAHWGEDGIWWRWSDGGVEATSFALAALLTIDPKSDLIEPVTNWLIKNRRGSQWSNTRDTAIAILALNQYLRESGELKPDIEYEIFFNGTSVIRQKLTADDALTAPSRFSIDRDLIRDGSNEIRIVRKAGDSPLYFSAEATFFSLEEPVTPAGNEIFVRRQYFKLVGRPTLLKGFVYHREPLNDGEELSSGDRVETVITIEGKNNYEYLVFEDLKPAGLEAVQIRSGESIYARELKSGAVEAHFSGEKGEGEEPKGTGSSDYTNRSRWVYQELRDRKIALFIDKLPEGVWEIRYDLRAEVPGKFHALPVTGHAMYVPEIRCNGAETRITVIDSTN